MATNEFARHRSETGNRRGMHFINSRDGWLPVSGGAGGGGGGVMLTHDGGHTWHWAEIGHDTGPDGVSQLGPKSVWAIGGGWVACGPLCSRHYAFSAEWRKDVGNMSGCRAREATAAISPTGPKNRTQHGNSCG